MKAYFKDDKRIIFNSMDYTEALVGKAFLDNSEDKYVVVEERYDVNDDFDGLVLTIGDKVITEEEVQERIDTAVAEALANAEAEFAIELKEAVDNAIEETTIKVKTETQVKAGTVINTAKSVSASEEDIRYNAGHCSVNTEENKITVVDQGLKAYVGGPYSEPKKWVGLLVDLNTKVQGTTYQIEDIDYADAKRWGASNDTTFVMWLTTEQGGTYTFTNVDDETQSVDLTVEFTEED